MPLFSPYLLPPPPPFPSLLSTSPPPLSFLPSPPLLHRPPPPRHPLPRPPPPVLHLSSALPSFSFFFTPSFPSPLSSPLSPSSPSPPSFPNLSRNPMHAPTLAVLRGTLIQVHEGNTWRTAKWTRRYAHTVCITKPCTPTGNHTPGSVSSHTFQRALLYSFILQQAMVVSTHLVLMAHPINARVISVTEYNVQSDRYVILIKLMLK